ncbi:excisionase family DNA-binding protein [Mycolicibacterium iranicum]|uniref:excisionase family DNA-binding protein n=1 Tax=Mycolicibacterium iranicum TaxID=912594 RepID=UPI000465E420|nr:excisionase family DNA-binding protein [Mycolicibacterium iranicum]
MAKTDTPDDLLPTRPTIQQAAGRLNCSDKTIRRMIADGRLKAYRVGSRSIRVDRGSLLALEKPMFAA